MNYLAHAYLSFNNTNILVGNMISDYVKGKTKYNYSNTVQQGITLHRKIDAYTDSHRIVKEAKLLLQPHYRLYSGAFVDVIFDHYLAKKLHTEIDLMAFSQHTYNTLQQQIDVVPLAFAKMLPYMQQHNWLYNYQYNWAMLKSFKGLQHRAKYLTEVETAFQIFENEYSVFEQYFHQFWNELYTYTKNEFEMLDNSSV